MKYNMKWKIYDINENIWKYKRKNRHRRKQENHRCQRGAKLPYVRATRQNRNRRYAVSLNMIWRISRDNLLNQRESNRLSIYMAAAYVRVKHHHKISKKTWRKQKQEIEIYVWLKWNRGSSGNSSMLYHIYRRKAEKFRNENSSDTVTDI